MLNNREVRQAFTRSLAQLRSHDIQKSLAVYAVLSLLVTATTAYYLIQGLSYLGLWTLDGIQNSLNIQMSSDGFIGSLTSFFSIILGWLLFTYLLIPISSFVSMFFEDGISKRVLAFENSPLVAQRREVSITATLRIGIRYLFFFLLANLLAIPFYLTLPIANIFIFLLVNGFILGKQLYHGLLVYYIEKHDVRIRLIQSRTQLLLIGSILSSLFLIPMLNLLVPAFSVMVISNFFAIKFSETRL